MDVGEGMPRGNADRAKKQAWRRTDAISPETRMTLADAEQRPSAIIGFAMPPVSTLADLTPLAYLRLVHGDRRLATPHSGFFHDESCS